MQLDEKAYNFIRKAKEAGASKEEVASYLKGKGYDFQYSVETKDTEEQPALETPTEEISNQSQESAETNSSGFVSGFTKKAISNLLLRQGSRLAGMANTGPGKIASLTNPILAVFREGSPIPKLEDLDPRKVKEDYQKGSEKFLQQQETFAKEHPAASTIAGVGGDIASFFLPVGAAGKGVQAAVAASKIGKAGKLGMLGSRIAGETVAGALYGGVTEGFGDGQADLKKAGAGAREGAALFGALSVLGGGARIAEEGLLQLAGKLATNPGSSKLLNAVASQVAKHPVAAQRAVQGLGLAAEGTVLGTLPNYLNNQEITLKDVREGLAWAAGGRAAAKGLSWVGEKGYKFANTPTAMEVEEAKQRAKTTKSIGRKQERANILEAQLKEEKQAVSDISKSFEEGLEGDVLGLTKVEEGAEAVKALADESGWTVVEDYTNKNKDSRYITLEKEGNKKKIRISNHDGKVEDIDYNLDLRKKGSQSIEELSETLGVGEETSAKLNKVRNRIERQIGELEGEAEPSRFKVSANEKEIDDFMKEHSSNPNMTPEKAARIIETQKTEAAFRTSKQQQLPLKERMLRGAKELTSKIITQFNWARPIEEGIQKSEALTGRKVSGENNPVYTVNKLNNGGQQEALIAPVFEKAKQVEKKFKGSIQGANEVLQAEKRLQMAKDRGISEDLKDLEIVNMYKNDAPVQEIVKEVRKLNGKVLDRLYESGRIDIETYNKWKKNDAYVPSWVKKFGEDGEQVVANSAESYLKKYEGKGAVYENAILSSMGQGKYIDQFAEMQKAKKQYLALAERTGDAFNVTPSTEYKGGPVKFDSKKEIVVWKDGKPQIWRVPERVASFFNPEKIVEDKLPTKVAKAFFGFPLRVYKGGTTAVSAGFSQTNIVRDVQGAVIGSQHGEYISPEMIRSSMGELIKNDPIAKELKKGIGHQTMRDIEQLPGLAEDNIKEFVNMYESIDKAGKEGTQRGLIARMFATALPNGVKKLAKVSSSTASKTLDAMSYAGNLAEETTRLSVFKSVLKAAAKDEAEYALWVAQPDRIPSGLKEKAWNEAREVTLNFKRKMAPWVETANKYFLPYFKPALLGTMRGFEVLTNPEIAPKAWRTMFNLGIAQGLVNGKVVDKKQLEELDAFNNEMGAKNFLYRNKEGKLLVLPMAQEFAPIIKMIAGVTEKIYRKATKQQREDIGREMEAARIEMAKQYLPGIGYFTEPSNLIVGQIPKTILEEYLNKNVYSGTPIVPEYLQDKPASMQYTKSASQSLVALSKALAKHGVEISPMRMQHIAGAFGSNTAKEMLGLSDSVLQSYGIGELRPKKEATDNPLIRRFVANITAPYNQYNQDAREIVTKNKAGYNVIKKGEIQNISKQQKDRYMEQYMLYNRIKPSVDNLDQLRIKRKNIESTIAVVGNAIKARYDKGELSRDEMLREREKTIKAFNSILDVQNALERQHQLEIIKGAKDFKETLKRNPKNK